MLHKKIVFSLSTAILTLAIALPVQHSYAASSNGNGSETPGTRLDCRGSNPNKIANNKNCNKAPVITTTHLPDASQGQAYTTTITYTDSHHDAVTFSLLAAPQGMSISAAGVLQWLPGSAALPSQTVTIAVADNMLGSQATFTLVVHPSTTSNHAPQFTTTPITTGAEAVAYSYTADAMDTDGQALTYTLVQAPQGMSLTGRTVSFTPTYEQAGSYNVTLAVSDGVASVAQHFTLVIANTNRPPVINSHSVETVAVSNMYRYVIDATDADNDVLQYTVLQAPTGLTLQGHELIWQPSSHQTGHYVFTVQVNDGLATVSQTITLDVLHADTDADGYYDEVEQACGSDAYNALSIPMDTDNDLLCDALDTDDDGDGVTDADELACLSDPLNILSVPVDTDHDGLCNPLDNDDDNDGVDDDHDAFPLDAIESVDTDNDGIGNHADTDDDNDGVLDSADAFPLDATESVDTDMDGIGNNADTDDDNDGVDDDHDAFPLDATESVDTDNDGIGNNADTDDDNDGVLDSVDVFPLDATESQDLDGDGIGDNADTDIDGDGVPNLSDAYPLDATRSHLPIVLIDSPATLTTVGVSPVTVTGHVEFPEEVQSLTLNGQSVTLVGQQFSGLVSLEEGHNVAIARMVTQSGIVSTASISVSLDKTPPYITLESHKNGQVVYTPEVQITGLINDIVRGTVEATQTIVKVNGQPAQVSNRSYSAAVTLQPGINNIMIQAYDQASNASTLSFVINYQPLIGQRLNKISGDQQQAMIGTVLAQPLTIQVLDNNGQALANQEVIFRVIQGSGQVAANGAQESQGTVVKTDASGKARTYFRVGQRVGVSNNKISAKVIGFVNEEVFTASASNNPVDKLSVNSGNNQRGAVFTPLPSPFIVIVTDAGPNVVGGVKVKFSVAEGGGLFQNGESTVIATTDSDGRASALMTLGGLTGTDQQRVIATVLDANNEPTLLYAGFTASGFNPGEAGNTKVSGFVLDNQDQPLSGVTIRIEGTTRQAISNDQGAFVINEAPVGPVHLLFDGSTATQEGEFPSLSSNIVTVAGIDNTLSAPMYMVKLNTANAVTISNTAGGTITLPDIPGFALEIAPHSATFPDGSHEGKVSVTVVNSSALPMAPPNGIQPDLIVTIQPTGTQFYPPAKLTLPNTAGRAPGDQVEMFSYDHDLEEFVAIGLGTVSKDGSLISSNVGVGVIKAGWHSGASPSGSGSGTSMNCSSNSSDLACSVGESEAYTACDATAKLDNSQQCSAITDTTAGTHPINITNGNLYEEEVDYVGPGPFPIVLGRYYNSRYAGWTHSYNYGLYETTRPAVQSIGVGSTDTSTLKLGAPVTFYQLRFPDGRAYLYSKTLNGTLGHNVTEEWKSYADRNGRLEVVTGKPWKYEYRNSQKSDRLFLDAQGRVVRIERKDGLAQTISYSQGKMLVNDVLGNQAILTLSATGALQQATINGLAFTYDNNKVTYPDGKFKQYQYEKHGYLTAIVDEKGVVSHRWTYDRYGRATSSQAADGTQLIQLRYESQEINPVKSKLTVVSSQQAGSGGVGLVSSIVDGVPQIGKVIATNEYGKQTIYSFEKVQGSNKIVKVEQTATQNTVATAKTKTYYDNGNLYRATDWQGTVWQYAYDTKGRVIEVIRAKDSPQQRITTLAYNDNDQIIQKTESGRTTQYLYNAQYQLQRKTIGNRVWSYQYNPLGLLTNLDGPRTDVNDITQLEYDASGRVSQVTNALGHVTQLLDYNSWNLPETLVDANHTRTELRYDRRGRLLQSTVKSRQGDAVTQFTLDDEGLITAITLPNGVQLFNEYDNADRLITLRDADGNSIHYIYDAHGNRTAVTRKDATGTLLQQQQWLYDDLGRVMQALGGEGQTHQVSYNVNSQADHSTDGNHNEWQQQYDALDRLTSAYDPLLHQVQYGYDGRDNLTQVTDQRGLQTTYTYNTLDQVTSITSPDTGTQTLHYDNAGNLSDSVDAKGQRVDYSYDALNRLTTVSYANAAALNMTYSYDQYDIQSTDASIFNAGVGRLTQITDASGVTQYRYDDKGNVHTRMNQRGGIQLNTTYQYDVANNLTGIGYPGGLQISYQRNHLAQVTAVQLTQNGTTTTLVDNIAYQAMGPITHMTWGNGLSQQYSYDQSGRVSGYALSNGSKNISFGYDGNNNITQQVDIVNALNNYGYSYDEINRLLSEEGSLLAGIDTGLGSTNTYNKTFTYDAVGNRLSKAAATQNQTQTPSTNDEPYTYASNSNRLQSVNGATYQYDANGNAISKGNQSWAYNAQNRMASYSENGITQASYTYSGQGERVSKQLNGETIHYLYNAAGQLQGEYHYNNGNLTLRQSYVWLGMLPIAMIKEDLAQQSQQIVYIHSDQLNTPRMVTDQSQTTVWQWHSSAFGEELPIENGLVFNLRFPGQYYDVESGTVYNYYRDYDPSTGRYVESDPIGLRGGINTYGYAYQNPLTYTDPEGTNPVVEGVVGAAIIFCSRYPHLCVAAGVSLYCLINPSACELPAIPGGECPIDFSMGGGSDDWWNDVQGPVTALPEDYFDKAQASPGGPDWQPDDDDDGNKTPGNNQAQNKQFNDATRGLSEAQKQMVHQEITGKGYSYQQIKAIADAIKSGKY